MGVGIEEAGGSWGGRVEARESGGFAVGKVC